MTVPSPLIDSVRLYRSRSHEDVVLDASWFMPAEKRDPDGDFLLRHIPHARRFDFDRVVVDQLSDLPHMLPPPAEFQTHARRLGINRSSRVVVYDTAGIFAAPRAWWMFKVMGHDNSFVLQGGLPAWLGEAFPVAKGKPEEAFPGDFLARPNRTLLATAEDIRYSIASGHAQIVDARPVARFTGGAEEPRPGLRSGHMPGARNLPFNLLLSQGRFRSAEDIADLFMQAGIDPARPIVATCGSGVTATILALGAELAFGTSVAVYDGSWAEWGAGTDVTMPVETRATGGERGSAFQLMK